MTNRAIVEKFADLLYRQKKVADAFNTYAAKHYIQHSPMLGDGTEEVISALTPKFANPEARFTVRRIIVDRDYAVVMIHTETSGRQGAVVDIYRLGGGKIVEHWDIGAEFPDLPKSAHPLF
jgi:predicted SnoaL-like aldol condensation-catalyzing enzyme